MKTTAQKIEVMQASEQGKKIEERFWFGNWVACPTPQWDWNHFDYRVAEEPKLVPWDYKSIPMPICWIRNKSEVAMFMITACSVSGIKRDDGKLVTYNELFDEYEHSTDGKTWLPCGKEL